MRVPIGLIFCSLFFIACSHDNSSPATAPNGDTQMTAAQTNLLSNILAANVQNVSIDQPDQWLSGTPIGDTGACSLYLGSQQPTEDSPYDFSIQPDLSSGVNSGSESMLAPFPEVGWNLDTSSATFGVGDFVFHYDPITLKIEFYQNTKDGRGCQF
jgi:hypothetical protein